MRISSFFVIASVLSLGVTSSVASEPNTESPSLVLNINCDTNEDVTMVIRIIIAGLSSEAKPLQEARVAKQLTEESNSNLLQLETGIAEHQAMLSRYEFAQFYCDNPELLQKEEESLPIDPASVA